MQVGVSIVHSKVSCNSFDSYNLLIGPYWRGVLMELFGNQWFVLPLVLSGAHPLAPLPISGGGSFFVIWVDDPISPGIVQFLATGVFNGVFTRYLGSGVADYMVCNSCTIKLGDREIEGSTVTLLCNRSTNGQTIGVWMIVEGTGFTEKLHGHGTWIYNSSERQGAYNGMFLLVP